MNRKLITIFKSAVNTVDPTKLIRGGVSVDESRKIIQIFGNVFNFDTKFHVIGFGKAVANMAKALQEILKSQIKSGVLSVPVHSEIASILPIRVYQGAQNNLPDFDSLKATENILRLVDNIPTNDVILILISGGGSSLFCKPALGVSLDDKLSTIKLLTQQGANIQELNAVRRKISVVKGGGFGNYLHRHSCLCLVLSDVIGDPLDIIASGPTVAYSKSISAIDVINRYQLENQLPQSVLKAIHSNTTEMAGKFENIQNIVIGSNTIALQNAKLLQENESCKIVIVSSEISGLVSEVGKWYSDVTVAILKLFGSTDNTEGVSELEKLMLRQSCRNNVALDIINAKESSDTEVICLILGGETTVKVQGTGKGGRNQELAVIFANYMHQLKSNYPSLFNDWDVTMLCAGTDGIDGPTDVAGAIGCANLIEKGEELGLKVDMFLANNDSYSYLSKIDFGSYFVTTGHTGTNVMDIHILAFSKLSCNGQSRRTSKL